MSDAVFTDRELDVMGVIWELGSGTVNDVRDRIEDDLAYTTVLTILRTLEMKGYLRHEQDGRAYRYYPLVERDEARRNHLARLTRKLFSGSTELLLTHLVSERKLKKKELLHLQDLVNQRLKK